MKVLFLFLIIELFTSRSIEAQYYSNQNKVWCFGTKAGIDFSSGIPSPISTSIEHLEGCMSVSDSKGSLLFYTDGKKIFNKNHVLMPSGASIVPYDVFTTTQAALVVPVISNMNQYYIFSLESTGPYGRGRIAYSIVDMTQNGGLGDVVSTTMGTIIEDSLSEKMIAVAGNNKNIWLILHRNDTAIFLAYEINSTGINTFPVVSAVGTLSGGIGYKWGVMKGSPNRHKIVSQSSRWATGIPDIKVGTEIYDFDPNIGVVSNCVVLDSINDVYGAEFSPNSRKLYSQQHLVGDTMTIYQYDLMLSTAESIRASKTEVATVPTVQFSDLKLGPDGKIYMVGYDESIGIKQYSSYLDCINLPNSLGISCNYVRHAVEFLSGTGVQVGLPNLFVTTDTSDKSSVADLGSQQYSFGISPNPCSAYDVTISTNENIENVHIVNAIGETVIVYKQNSKKNSITLNVSHLPKATYLVIVNGDYAGKLIRE